MKIETYKKITLMLSELYENGTTKLKTFGNCAIDTNTHGNKVVLRRTFNNGNGSLDFAIVKNDVLIINGYLLKKSERVFIEKNISVPYLIVNLGYPDYYTKSLYNMA